MKSVIPFQAPYFN